MHSVDQLVPLSVVGEQHVVVVGELHARTGRRHGILLRHYAHSNVVVRAVCHSLAGADTGRLLQLKLTSALPAPPYITPQRTICDGRYPYNEPPWQPSQEDRRTIMKYSRRDLGLLLPAIVAGSASS